MRRGEAGDRSVSYYRDFSYKIPIPAASEIQELVTISLRRGGFLAKHMRTDLSPTPLQKDKTLHQRCLSLKQQ